MMVIFFNLPVEKLNEIMDILRMKQRMNEQNVMSTVSLNPHH